jgi:hypothetical protein
MAQKQGGESVVKFIEMKMVGTTGLEAHNGNLMR